MLALCSRMMCKASAVTASSLSAVNPLHTGMSFDWVVVDVRGVLDLPMILTFIKR